MKNYIFLLLAIALIGIGVFVLGGDSADTMSMAKRSARGSDHSAIPLKESLLSLSTIANITGILSFVIQIGIWAKSGKGKK